MNTDPDLRYRSLLTLAVPLILANAAVPLLGLADTTIIGRTGSATDLAAIALGSLIFSFVYLSFGFLRMGTTGFVAQAFGAGNHNEILTVSIRAGITAGIIGIILILLQIPIREIAWLALGGETDVQERTNLYFHIRIWGAPFTLLMYALSGTLIGLGENRKLLILQLILNGLNMLLNIVLAGFLGWGIAGIAAGTIVAELVAATYGFFMVKRTLQHRFERFVLHWDEILHLPAFRKMMSVNADILIRTFLMMIAFGWFARLGAERGETILAANHVLLQFIAFSAFFLDGYAFVTESLAGKAFGSRDKTRFLHIIRKTNILAGVTSVALALLVFLAGDLFTAAVTTIPEVRAVAGLFIPYAAVYILVAVWAFQMDGIFIGTTSTRAMRNASFISVVWFLMLSWPLVSNWGNHGLWIAFILYAAARALTLAWRFPGILRSMS